MADRDRNTDPRFVRESLTFRRMHPWQIAVLAAIFVIAVILAVWWVS